MIHLLLLGWRDYHAVNLLGGQHFLLVARLHELGHLGRHVESLHLTADVMERLLVQHDRRLLLAQVWAEFRHHLALNHIGIVH